MPEFNDLVIPYCGGDVDKEEGVVVRELITRAQQPFPDPDAWLEGVEHGNLLMTRADQLLGWARQHSLWPLTFGLACCAFEMMGTVFNRFDVSRFGMEVLRASPRQADLLIVSGTLTWKMAPAVRRLYEQMPEPKWVIAMGSCAISGGTFSESYSVVPGVNRIIPVDVYVPGCPPRPESLIYGFMELHKKIQKSSYLKGQVHLPGLEKNGAQEPSRN